jgi:putative ABC transport system substrate-binding protein
MQFDQLKRRDFMALLGGVAAWPIAARAQQAVPVVGFLYSATRAPAKHLVAGFLQGLKETGYVEGQTVAIEYRWAEGQYDRLPALAADLVQRQVAVIAALGGDPSALAAKAASASIPIVFNSGTDPVKLGLVTSLNRPGGNVTGVSVLSSTLLAKQLEFLYELVPTTSTIAFLVYPQNPNTEERTRKMQEVIRSIGGLLHVARVSTDAEFEPAFATVQQHAVAMLVPAEPFFVSRRDRIVALAARHSIPASYPYREYVMAGGLMSYGINLADAYRLAGVYTGRILKGAKPADLPVEQSAKVELVINLEAAKQLGLTFPITLSARADEVIE